MRGRPSAAAAARHDAELGRRAAAYRTMAGEPQRCTTNLCTAEGDCAACNAAQGEDCRLESVQRFTASRTA